MLLDKIRSNNSPWTLRQLRQGGFNATPALCEDLVKKEFVIKVRSYIQLVQLYSYFLYVYIKTTAALCYFQIDMGAKEEPMYVINLKKSKPAANSRPALKRQLPPPPSYEAPQPSKTPRLNQITDSKISSKIAHDSINKNPISAITELGQALGCAPTFNITRTSGWVILV